MPESGCERVEAASRCDSNEFRSPEFDEADDVIEEF